MVELPEQEYIHVEENGRMITYCTLRQKALHTIGPVSYTHLDVYKRQVLHGAI